MFPLVLLLFVITAFLTLLMPLILGAQVYRSRRGPRHVTCPETKATVVVHVDAAHSVATALNGPEYVRLSSCTRWPSRAGCDQDCVFELIRKSETEEAPARPGIGHVPVVVGAALAWLLGAIWYSRPLFRSAWMQAHGLTVQTARLRAAMILPYLLPFAGFLVLGYFVAWHIRHGRKPGIARGVALGAALCATYLLVEWLARQVLPGPWLPMSWVERSYVVVAGALTAGIVSGWQTLRTTLRLD